MSPIPQLMSTPVSDDTDVNIPEIFTQFWQFVVMAYDKIGIHSTQILCCALSSNQLPSYRPPVHIRVFPHHVVLPSQCPVPGYRLYNLDAPEENVHWTAQMCRLWRRRSTAR